MTRLLVLQPYLTEYRVPFFQELQQQLLPEGITVLVGVGRLTHPRGDAAVMDVPTTLTRDRLGSLTGDRLRWRQLRLDSLRPDLIVTEFATRNLESVPLLFSTRPVALWGHGLFSRWDKRALVRRAGWFFAYTDADARSAGRAGLPSQRITAVRNSTDTRDLWPVSPDDAEAFRARHGLVAGHTALYLGAVEESKGVGYLLAAAEAARHWDPDFRWVVAGSGSALPQVRRSGLPLVPVGRVTGTLKATALAAADIVAMPAAIGLVAVDALVAGRPIVTRVARGHGPESQYLDRSQQSVWLDSNVGPEGFAQSMIELLADEQKLRRMQRACRADADLYGVEQMARRFAQGVRSWAGG